MLTRRDSLKLTLALAAAAAGAGPGFHSPARAARIEFTVPPLGYGFDALEPYVDTATMMIHHDRHHGAYVTALNGLAEKYPDLATKSPVTILSDLASVPEVVRAPVRNNLGGHWNHSFFWELMTPGGAKEPGGDLKSAIDSAFGSTADLIEKVNAAGLARFGSGWAWLIVDKSGKLDIVRTSTQTVVIGGDLDNPLPLFVSCRPNRPSKRRRRSARWRETSSRPDRPDRRRTGRDAGRNRRTRAPAGRQAPC